MNRFDRLLGCLIGGWVGDAIEINDIKNKYQKITYISEMELSAFNALINRNNNNYIECVCNEYIEWYKSEPINIDETIIFSENINNNENNKSLMRCAYIPLCFYKYDNDYIYNIAINDCKLTHNNEIVCEITGIYCVLLKELIINDKSRREIIEIIYNYIKSDKIKIWFNDSKSLDNINCNNNIKHIKHSFMLCIYFLYNYNKYTFEDMIKTIIIKGGDINTNCKIVGNMYGCIRGFSDIPHYMFLPVINNENNRPKKYIPKFMLRKIIRRLNY